MPNILLRHTGGPIAHGAEGRGARGNREGQRLLRHHGHEAVRRIDARGSLRKGHGRHVVSHWHALELHTSHTLS